MGRFGRLAFFGLAIGVVGCDHATKQLATDQLGSGRLELVSGLLDLRTTRNTDTAFGLLANAIAPDVRWLLITALTTLIVIGVAIFVARRWKTSTSLERAASALLVGGALGNLLDRWFRGFVVDFIHVRYWPIFNVADVAICIGIALLAMPRRTRHA